jgi:hypothetical protein
MTRTRHSPRPIARLTAIAVVLVATAGLAACGDPARATTIAQIQDWLSEGNMVFDLEERAEDAGLITAEEAVEVARRTLEPLGPAPGSDPPPGWQPLDENPVFGRFSCTAPNCVGYAPDGPRLAWLVWGGGTPPGTVTLVDATTAELFFLGGPSPADLTDAEGAP